ncbi:hypothetical protein KB874_10680 [Aestuariicoccus sp. KMU-90]|uniref:Uncharacterized protein n=2 Tax=Thetidibacter halocola TaxID=2827239 RepID=A0A8J7WBP4_9RHOB|nr:hypothetical protein [Thetidibacter halocola]
MLTLSGAAAQVPTLLRHCIECAFYAYLFSKDKEWEALWWDREVDQNAKRKLRAGREGPLSAARNALGKEDKQLLDRVNSTIDMLIDYGAHPNIFQLVSASEDERGDDRLTYKTFLLGQDEERVRCFVKTGVTGIDVLSILDRIWPIRFGACRGHEIITEAAGQLGLYIQANRPFEKRQA